jgi:lipopolysaccharide assembly outer membrane protein LptD (OstA)
LKILPGDKQMFQQRYSLKANSIAVLLCALSAPALDFAPAFAQSPLVIEPAGSSPEQVRMEIPFSGNKLVMVSDTQETSEENRYRAVGNVDITFLDMRITCNEAEYDRKTLQVSTRGKTRFRRPKISVTGSAVELDSDSKTVTIHNASGYFYDTEGRSDREFFLTGGMSQKIKAEELHIYWGGERQH